MGPAFHRAASLMLLVAVAVSTALGGIGPGLLSSVLGAMASAYWLLEPHHELAVAAPADRVFLLFIILAGVGVGALGARLRRTAELTSAREEVARHQAESYRRAIETTQDLLWDWDFRTDHVAWSDGIARIFGWKDAANGTDTSWWNERIHPDDRERVHAEYQAILERGESFWAVGYRFQRADGSYAEVLDRGGWAMRDEGGEVVRLVGAIRDVTEHRHAEQARRESEAKYLAIFERNMVPMCIRHQDGRIVEANDAYLRLTRHTREDLRAGRISWSAFTLPGEIDRDERAMQEVRENGTCTPYEKIYALPDGRRVPVLIGISRLDDVADRRIAFVLDLSDLKRAEESLRESELRFRQLAENIRDVFWVMDLAARRVIYASPAYEQIWGMSCEALYADYRVWEHTIYPEDREHAATALLETVRQGFIDEEYRFFTADGQLRWARHRAFPIADDSGKVYRIAGIAEDITERRQAEVTQQFLVDLAERMSRSGSPTAVIDLVTSAVAEHLAVARCAFCELEAGGEHLRIEREFCRGLPALVGTIPMSSIREQVVADKRIGRVVTSSDMTADPRAPSRWQECCREHGIRALAAVPLLRNGSFTAMLWVGSDRARTWADAEVALLRTVAERAWLAVENARFLEQTLAALRERDASLRALQDSDMRLELALEAARVGIYDHDLTTDSMICSPGYAVLFGRALGTFARCGTELRRVMHPEDLPRVEHNLAVAIAQRQQFHCEYRVTWPDGSIHWLEGRGRLFYEDEGKDARAVRMLGVLVDTTDRKAMEAERALLLAREQAARAAAESASRAKDEFLAMLSHELRNPLNAIGTAVAVLAQLGDRDALLVRARDVIDRQLRLLAGLVDELLDVARVTSGKIVLHRRPFDLGHAVARHLAARASPGHRITAALEPVWIEGDETRIEQIIGNLVTNAIKYTPEGGSISVKVRPEGEHALLIVQDTGIGIPGDMLLRIFDLFTQGHRELDRSQGGLGIGLTLVKRLVELHGGSIDAASDGPGYGSTFTVRLARIPAPALAVPAAPAPPAARASRRVLIVEDNADSREMLRAIVELAGHEVEVAGDGPKGVESALTIRPQVALVDVGLPGFDGYEVARRIRATEPGRDMVLLALTGYGQDADRRAAMDAGFDHHLVKPVEAAVLLGLLAGAKRVRD
jgi:PAS domain S-box-containing protein